LQRKKRRASNKLENLGIPEEELLRQQQELFAKVCQFCGVLVPYCNLENSQVGKVGTIFYQNKGCVPLWKPQDVLCM